MAGRRAPWALASGRFRPGTVLGICKCFSNCFKLQKLVQTSKIRRNL
jgi:hypothetical protein